MIPLLENWLLLSLASALFLTFQRILQKEVLIKEHATAYLTTFCILTTLLLLPFLPTNGLDTTNTGLVLILIKSALACVSWLLIVKAYRHMELSTVEPLKNLLPLTTLIFAVLLLGEKLTTANLLGVLLIITGSWTLEVTLHKKLLTKPSSVLKGKYMHCILLSLLIGGLFGTLDKLILREATIFTMMFLTLLFTSLGLLTYQHLKYQGLKDINNVVRKRGTLIFIIVCISLLADWTYFKAVANPATSVSLIAAVRRISALFVVLIGGELFHEKHLLKKTAACLIMLAGVALTTT